MDEAKLALIVLSALVLFFAIGLVITILVGILMMQNKQPETSSPASPPADMDCPQFASQVEAQAWFDQYFPEYGDIGRLDRDGDGRVCTSTDYSK